MIKHINYSIRLSSIFYNCRNYTRYFKIFDKYDNTDVEYIDEPFKEGDRKLIFENSNSYNSADYNGIFFDDENHIHYLYNIDSYLDDPCTFGKYISEVTLPTYEKDFKMAAHLSSWRANKILVGPKYCLSDLKTYKILDIPVPDKFTIDKYIADTGDTNLNLIKSNKFIYSTVLHFVASTGYVKFLKWMQLFEYKIIDSDNLIDTASSCGHVNILNWWISSNLNLKYSEKAVDNAYRLKYTEVFKWWIKSGLPLKYSQSIVDDASKNGDIDTLQMLKLSETPIKYSEYTIDTASANGRITVLEWWKTSGLPLKYSDKSIDIASENGNFTVLEWWKTCGLPLKYSNKSIDMASANGNVTVLEWWKTSGLPLKYSHKAMRLASRYGHIKVLDWWKTSGLPLKYNIYKLDPLDKFDTNVSYWWEMSGLPMQESPPEYIYHDIFGIPHRSIIPPTDIPYNGYDETYENRYILEEIF